MLVSTRWASLGGALLLITQTASAQPANFVAPLSGHAEVPSVDTRARGLVHLQLDAAATELSYRLTVSHLAGVTQAHIHCAPEGVNGPPVAFLFALMPAGVDVSGVLSSGGITDANVIPRPDTPECPGGVTDLADVLEQMEAGGTYVNVHTLEHPAGEIRGQLQAVGPGR